MRRRIRWLVVGSFWLGGIIAGLALITSYDFTAGAAGPAQPHWPPQSRIPFSHDGHTLVMFAHPRCPCTRASLGELGKLVARCPDALTSWVIFFKPSGAENSWEQTDQWFTASKIPGVNVLSDVDGTEARLFHALTSGQTFLYGPSGELQFSGGITNARGHAGDNDGRSAIETILTDSTPATRETPVYGCPIFPPFAAK